MPALPDVPKVVRVAVHQAIGEDNFALNRFFISYGGTAPTDTELATFLGVVGTAWNSNILPMQPSSLDLTGAVAEDLTSTSSAVADIPLSGGGSRSGGALTAAAAAVIQQKIGRRYRGGHPRVYLYAGTESDLLHSQEWNTSFIGALEAAWAAFITAVVGAAWSGAGSLAAVNVSYYEGFTVVTNPITHRARNVPTVRSSPLVDLISSYIVNPKVGSQRRRNLQSS